MSDLLQHADKIMSSKPGAMLMVSEPVTVTCLDRRGTIQLPQGRRVRVNVSTGLTLFGIDAETLESVSFGMKEAAAFDVAP